VFLVSYCSRIFTAIVSHYLLILDFNIKFSVFNSIILVIKFSFVLTNIIY
jgi:hypothetical protein